jgi:CRISPR-associated protein Cmr2
MNLWKRKLAAYLHDPPSKALDIRTHGERSDAAFHRAGFVDTEIGDYFSHADHTGAAADRLPFPTSRASGLACAFDGVRNAFRHPLSGHPLPFHAEFKSAEQGIEGEESVQPLLTAESLAALADEDLRWRARFFAHWRLWPKHASEKDYRLALLPADTRIPDHSIWTHMQVVSALDGCVGVDNVWQPAFLKFQLGPVQDFIAAARSIRDLWSGSYLLSWLMAAGMKALAAEVGPDAVIFPNLRGQPLFDLQWRHDLWSRVNIGTQSVWESLDWRNRDLLTPNLANVFLAVVPADQAADLGRKVANAIAAEWQKIADAVWTQCAAVGLTVDEGGITASERKTRFEAQVSRFLSLSWQATPWPERLEDALKLAEGFDKGMPVQKARAHVQAVVNMATQQMPVEHRDSRYYVGGKDGPKTQLNNIGLGWSVILAANSWGLDAVRQTRHFDPANSGGWQTGAFNNKDSLTGREEAVAGGAVWTGKTDKLGGAWKSLFKHADWLSAPTLVKRLWHLSYLAKSPWSLATSSKDFPMPNTRSLAAHDPFGRDDDFGNELAEETDSSEKYFAVLALDGDEIGKWVSGEKTPVVSSQLADYRDGSNTQRFGAEAYFENPAFKDFLSAQRPLSPSYHLQFSEALSNFALLCARPIVEAFDGRLIYAGGDDVVALLPADTALECARVLRLAFTGSTELKEALRRSAELLCQRHELEQKAAQKGNRQAAPTPYHQKLAAEGRLLAAAETTQDGKTIRHPGFLARLDDCGQTPDKRRFADGEGRPVPFLVPGPAADCSVGIAIAHFKSPLQDVVRAAQAAERRAKNPKGLSRSAVAVTLFKRSGETIEWGCQWADGGLELYQAMAECLQADQLSSKFPYRVVELLDPYLTQHTGLAKTMAAPGFASVVDDIIQREFAVACSRQRGSAWESTITERLLLLLKTYVAGLEKAERKIRAVIGLCQTVAFANRTRSENTPESPTAERQPA